ncbi:MAG: DNRLRE domain-containing protein [Micropruina sp.]
MTTIDTLSYRLIVGRTADSSNTHYAYSYVQWPNGEIAGRKILKATVNLYQYAAGSCATSKKMNIHPLVDAWDESATTWSNKPSHDTDTGTSSSLTKNVGGDGCPDTNAFVSADLTAMVQAWANGPSNGGFTNHGLLLNVPKDDEDDPSFERRFCSINYDPTHTSCNRASRVPYLTFTYNSAPAAAAIPLCLGLTHVQRYSLDFDGDPDVLDIGHRSGSLEGDDLAGDLGHAGSDRCLVTAFVDRVGQFEAHPAEPEQQLVGRVGLVDDIEPGLHHIGQGRHIPERR